MKLLLPVKSLGLLIYNPMYKVVKYTSHMKLIEKKNTFELAGRCKVLLIQEKLDGAAAESCKSGWTWLWKAGFVLKIFFTAWTLRRIIFPLTCTNQRVYICAEPVWWCGYRWPFPKQTKCCPSWTAMPTHHWLLEGTASFQKESAGSQTCRAALRHTTNIKC